MNTLVFDVYKNTIKKTDGFNPVNAEKGYTNLLFKFKKGDDWERCGAVTLSFFESSDDITHSQVDIKEDSLTATFRLPNAYKSLFLGITGVYIDDEGESVTVATNIIKINLIKGVIVTDSVNMDVYEKLMSYFATVRKSDLPMVDIRNFGAVPDNPSVDNAEAIKQAIEFASLMRGRVYIPPATFYVNSTIPIRSKENLTIVNDGIIYAKSKELKDNKFSVLFSCYQCKNLNFTAGTIKSDRDKIGKAPLNHTRENLNSSNIIGIHINDCEDIVVDNYTSIGLESALVIDAADGVVSKNIVLKQLKSFETSQPVYGSHFEKFTITDIYCEECPGCGLGDHFIYISSYAKDFRIRSGKLVYTDCKYGVAINLRYAGSGAGVNNGVLPDGYDASKDLDEAHIIDVDVEDCVQFISAKAKTKVYLVDCTINASVNLSKTCLFLSEYAELYVKTSNFALNGGNPLLGISNNASHNVTFNNCTIKTGSLFNIGSNSATDKDVFSKNIAFLNCDIVCNASSSPIWLDCASETNVSFVNTKLSTNRFYAFYCGNDNIRYSIIGTEIMVDESANGLRLIYTPYDTDNTSGYSPADNVQVINSVCRNIQKICSSKRIVDYNNVLFDKEGTPTSTTLASDEQISTAVENYMIKNPINDGTDYVLTETDKTEIAHKVIESLGGSPVFGYVDENNNIIVSGKLASGSYNVKYEMEDGSTVDIGELELDTNVYYSVTNNLTNCTNSNSVTQIIEGNSYTATISANSGYELSSVTITMNGTDITSTAVNGENISITNVTGDIVITAVANAVTTEPEETNYFNASTATLNHRLGSNGSPSAYDGMVVTDFIPIDSSMSDKLFRISGVTLIKGSTYSYCTRAVYYDENKTKVAENNNLSELSNESYNIATWLGSMTDITSGYIRISMVIKDGVALTSDDISNLIITLKFK